MERSHRPLTLALPGTPGPRVAALAARGAAVVLLALVGVVHLAAAPSHFQAAAYLGVLFCLATAASWLAAIGVAAGARGAWILGALVAAAAVVGLLLAVTTGLPGLAETLSTPWAVPALVVEGLYLALYAVTAAARRDPAGT